MERLTLARECELAKGSLQTKVLANLGNPNFTSLH